MKLSKNHILLTTARSSIWQLDYNTCQLSRMIFERISHVNRNISINYQFNYLLLNINRKTSIIDINSSTYFRRQLNRCSFLHTI